MQKIELDIVALSQSLTQSQSYAVVLGEKHGNRRLPIVIGAFEAQSIALALENMQPQRPLTHDLMKSICSSFKIKCQEVVIDKLEEGVFHSKLICLDENGFVNHIDSRTSDALALAIRFKCPIFTNEFILDQSGIVLDDSYSQENTNKRSPQIQISSNKEDFSEYTLNELNDMLNDYLANEDYEKAIIIRDELNRREEK